MSAVFHAIADQTDRSDPDAPQAVAAMQRSDPDEVAWSWAAGQHLRLEARQVIDDDQYDGDGHFIRSDLAASAYAGINGFARAEWCVVRLGRFELIRSLAAYPRLVRWTQDC